MANTGTVKTNGYEGRYLLFSWTLQSQSIKANTSTISWTLTGAGNAESTRYKAGNFRVQIDGATVYSTSEDARIWLANGTQVASGSYTLNHDAATGDKTFSVAIQGGIYTYDVNCKGSGNFTLPKISRISVITAASGTYISDNLTVTLTKYNTAYTDNLLIALNGATIQTVKDYTSGKAFTLTDTALAKIYTATSSSKTVTLVYTLQTYDGNTLLGTSDSLSVKLTINDSTPSVGGIDYLDTNETTTAITGNNKYIIRNYSTINITVSDITAHNGATLKTVNIKGGSIDKTVNISGASVASQAFNIGTINIGSNFELTATVTDSRGYTAVKTVTILVYDYNKPSAVVSCNRVENYYSDTKLLVNATCSNLGGNNAVTIKAQYKKTTATSYGAAINVENNTETTISLDNAEQWNVLINLTDKLDTQTYTLLVGKGIPIIFFDRLLGSVGINCFPKGKESLEVNGVNILKALMYADGDTININSLVTCGLVTTDAKKLRFSIPLDKSYAGLKPSFTSLQMYLRSTSGIMTQYAQVVGDSEFTITPITTSDNTLTVDIDKATAYSGVNGDTPVVVSVYATITFNTP